MATTIFEVIMFVFLLAEVNFSTSPIINMPALVQIMAWCQVRDIIWTNDGIFC